MARPFGFQVLFFSPGPDAVNPHSFVSRLLKKDMIHLRPTLTRHHISNRPFHIPCNLLECFHVFMRRDCHRAPLDCPHSGFYSVLSCTDKFFTIDLNTRVPRLPTKHIQAHTPLPPAPPIPLVPTTTTMKPPFATCHCRITQVVI